MPVKSYLCRRFQYEHETEAFDRLIKLFRQNFSDENANTYVIGQPYIEGKELDCLILRPNTLLIVDFKSYGGRIEGTENGRWQANGIEIGSTDGNPFQQLKTYKSRMYKWLQRECANIFNPQKSKEFRVVEAVSGLVLFTDGTIDDQTAVSRSSKVWFHVADFRHFVKTVQTLRGGVDIRSDEMQKIVQCLGVEDEPYDPDALKKTDWEHFLHPRNFQLAWARINRHSESTVKDYLSYRAFEKDLDGNIRRLIESIEGSATYTVTDSGNFQLPKNTYTCRRQVVLSAPDILVYQAMTNIIANRYESQLAQHAETQSFGNVYAGPNSLFLFKDWKSMYAKFHHAIRGMKKESASGWMAEIDIAGFYDNVQHTVLEKILQRKIDSRLTKLLIRFLAGCQAQWSGLPLPFGMPQGPIASHLLANVYLLNFDDALKEDEVRYVRYVDDFWIVSNSKADLIQTVVTIQNRLAKLGLSLQSSKTSLSKVEDADIPDFTLFGSYAEAPAFTDSPTISAIDPESAPQENSDIPIGGQGCDEVSIEELDGTGEYDNAAKLVAMFHENAANWLGSDPPLRQHERGMIYAIYRLYLRGHKDEAIKNRVLSLAEKMFWRFGLFSLYLGLFEKDTAIEDFLRTELEGSPYDYIKACCWKALTNVAPNKYAGKAMEVVQDSSREYTVRVGALEYVVKQSSYNSDPIESLLNLLKHEADTFFGKMLFHQMLAMLAHFKGQYANRRRSQWIQWGLEHANHEYARVAYLNSAPEDLEIYREESVKQASLNRNITESVLNVHHRLDAVFMQIGLLPEREDFDFPQLFTDAEYNAALNLSHHIHGSLAHPTHWNGACSHIWALIRRCIQAAASQELGTTVADYAEAREQLPQRDYMKKAVTLEQYHLNLRNKDINPEELKKCKQMAQEVLASIVDRRR